MAILKKNFGECEPHCNDCGVSLCWSIDISEYEEHKDFWDDWRCRDCNPDYEGAFKRYKLWNVNT